MKRILALATLVALGLSSPPAVRAALPDRIASSFFAARMRVDDGKRFWFGCDGSPLRRRSQLHTMVMDFRDVGGARWRVSGSTSFDNDRWSETRIGPYHERSAEGPVSDWKAGGGGSISGRGMGTGILRVAAASWGNKTARCWITIDGQRHALHPQPRDNARYWRPADGDGVAMTSDAGGRWATTIAAHLDGYAIAFFSPWAEGPSFAVRPDGTPEQTMIGERTKGIWRFTGAATQGRIGGFDWLTVLELPR